MVARRLGLGANSGIHRRSVQHDQPVSQRELQQQLDWINELFVEVLSRLPDADKIKKKRSSCSRFLTTIGTVVGILGFFFGLYVFIDGKISSIETNIGNSIKQMEKNLNISLEAKFQVIEGRFKVLEGRIDALEAKFEARFQGIEGRIDALEAKFEARFQVIEGRIDALQHRIESIEIKFESMFKVMEERINNLVVFLREMFNFHPKFRPINNFLN